MIGQRGGPESCFDIGGDGGGGAYFVSPAGPEGSARKRAATAAAISGREVRQEAVDLGLTHLLRVALAVEHDEPTRTEATYVAWIRRFDQVRIALRARHYSFG